MIVLHFALTGSSNSTWEAVELPVIRSQPGKLGLSRSRSF